MMQQQGGDADTAGWGQALRWAAWVGLGVAGLILLYLLLAILFSWASTGDVPAWSGFGPKTLWDWLQLLGIPILLALGGFIINRAAEQRDRQRNEAQERLAVATQEGRERSNALQSYLSSISQLLLDAQSRQVIYTPEFQAIVRAQTASVILQLGADTQRKALVFHFLSDSRMTASGNIPLVLRGVNMRGADLNNLDLSAIDLTGAILNGTLMRFTQLTGTLLIGANMRNADLSGADLSGANLTGADLRGAVVLEAQLAQAAMRLDMIWPDGTKRAP